MQFDIVLPIILSALVTLTVLFYRKLESKTRELFEERKLTVRDAALVVVMMGVTVTIVAFVPTLALQILLIAVYSYMMFTFVYVVAKKWYFAIILPFVFILTYVYYPALLVLNLFAAIFAIIVSVYLGTVFSWKTTLIFALMLTVMDVIHVFGTGLMIEAATRLINLKLPVGIAVPTFPAVTRNGIFLGLGDIFLSSLLAIQTSLKHGQKSGLMTAAAMGFGMLIFEASLFSGFFEETRGFPATVVIILGWALGMGIIFLNLKRFQLPKKKLWNISGKFELG